MRLQSVITRFDWTLMLAALALTGVGLVVMYGIGISRPDASLFLFQKQFVGAALGIGVIIAVCLVDYRQLRSLALPLYAFGAAILAGVLLFGEVVRGTRGWYTLGGLSFQPVEIAKICLVLFLASYLVRFVHEKIPWHALAGSFCATLVYMGLVLFQPDFGSAMVMLALWGMLVLAVGIPFRTTIALAAGSVVAGILAWNFLLQPYQQDRLMAFVNPGLDARGAGYNVTQARIAIGSGGIFGKGIGEGSQSRLRFLPEAATDFTFAVVGEELGFVGITFVLVLFGLLFYRLFGIARQSEDDYATLVIAGLGAILFIHLTVNAGMNLGVMPVTGIPLPFLSAATSFLISTFLCLGLIQSISVHRRAN